MVLRDIYAPSIRHAIDLGAVHLAFARGAARVLCGSRRHDVLQRPAAVVLQPFEVLRAEARVTVDRPRRTRCSPAMNTRGVGSG